MTISKGYETPSKKQIWNHLACTKSPQRRNLSQLLQVLLRLPTPTTKCAKCLTVSIVLCEPIVEHVSSVSTSRSCKYYYIIFCWGGEGGQMVIEFQIFKLRACSFVSLSIFMSKFSKQITDYFISESHIPGDSQCPLQYLLYHQFSPLIVKLGSEN